MSSSCFMTSSSHLNGNIGKRQKIHPCNSRQVCQMVQDSESGEKNEDEVEEPVIATSTVKIDDHGSDLTDRFKYKMNALLGKFDPEIKDNDNESTDGNILNAMLNFPTEFEFNVVGRTKGETELAEEYVENVKQVILSHAGDENIECTVTPRGKSFTKVVAKARVESSTMITNIYEELASMESTVMRF
ncbi:hypothetical protein CTEN210_10891 [Chaetoceros tenuissimus]|uniref:Uncharacterized protein n=1 Tax=Chaetoceros tenuissimus TaxID=426638 RepID=A0AAD3D0S1_9STRA|nr:hypothetical protein CTEN210_10891 [Chaetoceros tenuissimus]